MTSRCSRGGSRPLRQISDPASVLLLMLASLLALPTTAQSVPGPSGSSGDTLRTLQPEDLFRLHRVGAVRFSPDGRHLAFEKARAGNEGAVKAVHYSAAARSNIWIASVEDGEIRRLTDGGSDDTSWFHPRWSPDGERLALLSRRANSVRAWVWETSSGELRKVSDRAVHMESVGPLLIRWLSPDKLALAVQKKGAPERGRKLAEYTRPGLFAARQWRKSWSGREATVHVLSSGLGSDEGPFHDPVEVRVVDLTGSARTVARGRWGYLEPSPNGRRLATFSLVSVPWDRPLLQGPQSGTSPGVVELEGAPALPAGRSRAGAETLSGAPARLYDPQHGTLRWAPDGSAYGLLTRTPPDEEEEARGPRRVAIHDAQAGTLERISGPGRRVDAFAWTGTSDLLIRARSRDRSGRGRRLDWWRVDAEDRWRKVTRGMEEVPERLVPAAGYAALGVAGGELWRIGGDAGPRSLTEDFEPDVRRIVWPESSRSILDDLEGRNRRPSGPVAVMAVENGESGLWVVRFGPQGPQFHRVPTPERAVRPSSVSPESGAAAFSEADSSGTWLWLTSARGRQEDVAGARNRSRDIPTVDTLMAADRWLSAVEPGETRKLTYEHSSGRDLTAWMILPPGHTEEERHPTVVSIYPGSTQDDDPPFSAQVNRVVPIAALQLLASRGYAVLLPSIPLPGDAGDSRPPIDAGVLPAVERAVEAGLADSAALGLMGHSYGGYGVYHLVSQTDRFRAAVASAGPTDLRAGYGIFDARARYGHMTLPLGLHLFKMAYMETGQGRMGGAPWKAPERYRKNSPLTYVDEVETPLLMIHGDQDFVPIQHAEMFFSSLLRQQKQARLVRYFGEGHIIRGRANALDMWNRIFSWFDRFLRQQ